MAFAQAKDTFDNGAAASDKKEFEVFGAKIKNDMEIGFGDAIRSKRSNRLTLSETTLPLVPTANMKRDKRSAISSDFAGQIMNSKEMPRTKRETDDDSIEEDYSDEDDDYSSYSDSSSSESEENERRKRSIAYERLANIFI